MRPVNTSAASLDVSVPVRHAVTASGAPGLLHSFTQLFVRAVSNTGICAEHQGGQRDRYRALSIERRISHWVTGGTIMQDECIVAQPDA